MAHLSKNMYQLYPYRNLWVKPGSNHHVVVFSTSDGKQIGKVVSLLEVAQRIRRGEPVIDKTAPVEHPDANFLYTLTINDMFLDQVSKGELDWGRPDLVVAVQGQLYRVQKMDVQKRIDLRQHTVARVDTEKGHLRPTISTLRGQKVIVDAIGRITPADE